MDRRTVLGLLAGTAAGLLPGAAAAHDHTQIDAHADAAWAERFARLPGVRLQGDEQIAMLLYPGFTALDLVGPYHFLAGMMGAKVHLVSSGQDLAPVPSDLGLAIAPTVTYADCPRTLTLVFVPGGTDGTLAAARDPRTPAFLRDTAVHADYVTSVCTGALILGAAGLLRGRRATSHWSVRPLLTRFGATPVDARVVEDGKLITGAGVSAGLDFGLSVVARLRGQPYAAASMLTAEYDPQPPFPGGTLANTPAAVASAMTAMFASFVAAAGTLQPAPTPTQ
ncbi:DJ-1/PfpI family protein [Pseudoxanthomonas winnipegensis]|uniref:DJ-1/PfpI family protein n=1 Tax=Pseudoxanthomonas winnipegensis TaxID=2480810 RepID=UPI0030F4964A